MLLYNITHVAFKSWGEGVNSLELNMGIEFAQCPSWESRLVASVSEVAITCELLCCIFLISPSP